MLKIVITGPESTGKTTLAKQLADHYSCPWVSEYAREYIEQLDRPYQETDLLVIAQGQLALEQKQFQKASELLICDTDLLTIKIWSDYKYGRCTDWIVEQIWEAQYDWYFLCGTDVPWEYDPQREHPEQRSELFHIYNQELRSFRRGFMELRGTADQRLEIAKDQIDALQAGLGYNRFF